MAVLTVQCMSLLYDWQTMSWICGERFRHTYTLYYQDDLAQSPLFSQLILHEQQHQRHLYYIS